MTSPAGPFRAPYPRRMEPVFTRADARAYDRRCIEAFGIPGIVLMENAAIGCATIAGERLAAASRVTVACGPGQNGGDGYAIARHLAIAGHAVEIVALGVPSPGSDAAIMREIASRMGVPIRPFAAEPARVAADFLVDALFGTGLDRPLADEALAAVRWMDASGLPILAVDLPSGLDADTGTPRPACVRATVTATMAATKRGFAASGASAFLGEVRVVPIGGPPPTSFMR